MTTASNRPDTRALSTRLWDAVRKGDECAAVQTVRSALDAGLDAESALLDVVAPVQAKIGTEWAANRMSVAREHAATAVNDHVVTAVAHHASASSHRPSPGRVTVTCVDGEWHVLPARLLAETLRLRGWQVDFLGCQIPVPYLVDHLHRTGPDALALSSSIPTRLPTAHATIAACRAAGFPVIVGGAAFGPGGCYADRLGADGWAPDARAAADLLAEIVARRFALQDPRRSANDLPHLADREYTLVTHNAHRHVAAVLGELKQRLPAMAEYDEQQRERTAEDLAHIVDFLSAALYLDDPELFTRFIAWIGDILTARGVPARSMILTLDLLAARLKDLPRAVGLLREGQAVLSKVDLDLPETPA
ncbi:cobalamin-dependent protein [Actinoallomurus sp. NPDC052274]|uniref:cobalamin B12-binding domain-containing protein n=1 Tax=Actinoallomurus sp. NPDC052274 TaxID=3155420 RepID=UPI0034124C62